MTFEVEMKFAVDVLGDLERRLAELGSQFDAPLRQVDCYLRHPARDFAQTDEALRIRQVGDQNVLTYKGPKIDRETKTRREIELPLAEGPGGAAAWAELLAALGFSTVAQVHKQRREGRLHWQGRQVHVALDDVQEVGSYVELELLAEEADVPQAQQCLRSLAGELALVRAERRSYLELLLLARGATAN